MIAIRIFVLIFFLILQLTTESLGQNVKCDSVYTMVDEAPMFKSGYDELASYIDNLDYGDCPIDQAITLTWTIDRLGQMIDIDADVQGECWSRITTQLAKFPIWSPAKVMGMPVCFKMKLKKLPK